jgi:hypothetical protein
VMATGSTRGRITTNADHVEHWRSPPMRRASVIPSTKARM